MLKSSGRRVDLSQPFVDAMLPDGSRLHVVIPDITRRHWAVNICEREPPSFPAHDVGRSQPVVPPGSGATRRGPSR